MDGGLWREHGAVRVAQPFTQPLAEHSEYVRPCAKVVREKAFPSIEYC